MKRILKTIKKRKIKKEPRIKIVIASITGAFVLLAILFLFTIVSISNSNISTNENGFLNSVGIGKIYSSSALTCPDGCHLSDDYSNTCVSDSDPTNLCSTISKCNQVCDPSVGCEDPWKCYNVTQDGSHWFGLCVNTTCVDNSGKINQDSNCNCEPTPTPTTTPTATPTTAPTTVPTTTPTETPTTAPTTVPTTTPTETPTTNPLSSGSNNNGIGNSGGSGGGGGGSYKPLITPTQSPASCLAFKKEQINCAEMSFDKNFDVFAEDQKKSGHVLNLAEGYRRDLVKNILGETLKDRQGRSLITVEVDPKFLGSDGLTKPIESPEDTIHQVWIRGPTFDIALKGLAHEIVHTILDTVYPYTGDGLLPYFANEGAASKMDDNGRKNSRFDLMEKIGNGENIITETKVIQGPATINMEVNGRIYPTYILPGASFEQKIPRKLNIDDLEKTIGRIDSDNLNAYTFSEIIFDCLTGVKPTETYGSPDANKNFFAFALAVKKANKFSTELFDKYYNGKTNFPFFQQKITRENFPDFLAKCIKSWGKLNKLPESAPLTKPSMQASLDQSECPGSDENAYEKKVMQCSINFGSDDSSEEEIPTSIPETTETPSNTCSGFPLFGIAPCSGTCGNSGTCSNGLFDLYCYCKTN